MIFFFMQCKYLASIKNYNLFLIMGAMMLHSCQSQAKKLTQSELEAIVTKKTMQYKGVLSSGKLDSILAYYDEEASLSPDGFSLVQGRENIRNFLAKGMKMAKYSKIEFETDYISGNKNYIYHMGIMNSEIIVNDSLHFDNSAKFFYLWKLQKDGTYKIAAEVNNTKNENND